MLNDDILKLRLEQLSEKLIDMGAAEIGFADVTRNLTGNLVSLPYAISVAVKLSDFIINEITDKPTYTYFQHYRSVNALIDQITLQGVINIERLGFDALAVPASQTVNDKEDQYCGIFPHKTAAVKAGMGWIGKSGLFISNKFGPRVRLGTILTDLPVVGVAEEVIVGVNGCGDCRKCVESCPAMAFTGNNWEQGKDRSHIMDAKACSDYMNAKFKHIGRGSVCGICVKVCLVGNKLKI